jgi:CspA family cold shock protein
MAMGIVKWFKLDKGFGFITPKDGSRDVYVNVSALTKAGIQGLVEGQQVEYEVEHLANGKSAASNIAIRT